jgi:hypothetical protein
MSKVNRDGRYLFDLLTDESATIDADTLNTITGVQLTFFFSEFNSDIDYIKPTYVKTKYGVQDYSTFNDNPKKLLFDLIKKLNASESLSEDFIHAKESFNNITFNNFMLNQKDNKDETELKKLKELMNKSYNEDSTKYYISMFPPKYITKTNKAKKDIENLLRELNNAEGATPRDENNIKNLQINIGDDANKYPGIADNAATEAEAEEVRAAAAAAAASTDDDLKKAYEYARKHNSKAKDLKAGINDFITRADVAKCITAFDNNKRDKDAKDAATKNAKTYVDAKRADAKVSKAALSADTATNSALIVAKAKLQNTKDLKKIYDDAIIIPKPSTDPTATANKNHARDFNGEAQQTVVLAEKALVLYNRWRTMNRFIYGLESKINEVIQEAKDLVKEATNAVTLAAIKEFDDAWVIKIATTATTDVQKEEMLKEFANLINSEKINITKGTMPIYMTNGYGKDQYRDDTALPKVELIDESEYFPGSLTQWKIPKIGDSADRKKWRKKRIDRWTLNDLKLKYIFNDSNLLGIGKALATKAATTDPHFDIYKKLDTVKQEYFTNIRKIENEKKISGDSTEKTEAATPLVMSGGGKQYNKKTFKNKQFKRKQTHRKQTHRKQKHRKQKHRKQTHKK